MSLISKIAIKNESIDEYFDRRYTGLGGGITKAGTLVSQQTALRLSTLLACIRVKTEAFGCMPCSVMKTRKNGEGQDVAYDHPLQELLHIEPNPKMDAPTLREALNLNFDADGNCYFVIDWNRRGQVTTLTPVPFYNMNPYYDLINDVIVYYCYDRGKFEVYPSYKVYHVKGFSWDGLKGISVIRAAAETMGRGLAIDEFINRYFGQGMNFGLVIEAEGDFADKEEFEKHLEERYGGLYNSHRPIVLTQGAKLNRITIPFADAQLIEIMNLTDVQICGLMRVPPHMVAHLERSTNNNIEHQGMEFVSYSMLPIVTKHETEGERKLFSAQERAQGYTIRYDMDEFMRGDSLAQAQMLGQMRQNGIINADGWRILKHMNPIGGVAGQAYLVNAAMMSTENAAMNQPRTQSQGKQQKNTNNSAPTPAPDNNGGQNNE